MPKLVVLSAFARRGWDASSPSARQVFIIAHELGVGYGTLIEHLASTLRELDEHDADRLRRVGLHKTRTELAGSPCDGDVVVVDEFWRRSFVDVETGDVIIAPLGTEVTGSAIAPGDGGRRHLIAVDAGTAELHLRDVGIRLTVRVSKQGFTGLARYRHLEDQP
jgi:hypothetical protein